MEVYYTSTPRMTGNTNGFNFTLSEIKITPGCRHHSIKIYANGTIKYKYKDNISVSRNSQDGKYNFFTGDTEAGSYDTESTYLGSFNGNGTNYVTISTTMNVNSVKSTIEIN